MKTFTFAILLSTAAGVLADDPLLACGYALVNDGWYNQRDLALAACGREDTCTGKEWNTIFEIIPMSSGPASWYEMKSRGVFCDKGCWGDIGRWEAQCH
ncbi:hypothetical protein B0J18DRAFT_435359 [Chaetomium sp. MPI-SDFR-AT-0129]|nr:hypothetical protein B0J18DRAFT_435359 [Chaetomium sp. MPI-SDFR-AT-0129]